MVTNEEFGTWTVKPMPGSSHWFGWIFTYGDRLALIVRTQQPILVNPVKIHLSAPCHPPWGMVPSNGFMECRTCGHKTVYPATTRRWVDIEEEAVLTAWARVTLDPLEAILALEAFKDEVVKAFSAELGSVRTWEGLIRPHLLA